MLTEHFLCSPWLDSILIYYFIIVVDRVAPLAECSRACALRVIYDWIDVERSHRDWSEEGVKKLAGR